MAAVGVNGVVVVVIVPLALSAAAMVGNLLSLLCVLVVRLRVLGLLLAVGTELLGVVAVVVVWWLKYGRRVWQLVWRVYGGDVGADQDHQGSCPLFYPCL